MKTKLFTLAIIFFMGTTVVAQDRASRGTDVGGGGGGTDEGYHPHEHESQHHNDPWSDLSQWCTSTRAILKDYKYYAQIVRGDYRAVRETLVKGLEIALNNYKRPDRKVPFELLTLRSITRALELNDVLSEKGNEFENQVVSTLLSHFYNFIIDVNVSFDQNYLMPYFYHHHHCRWNATCPKCRPDYPCENHHDSSCRYKEAAYEDTFHAEFGKYVVKLLSFSLDRMEAMGSDYYELLLFENITGWAATDLGESIFRRRYDCVSTSLWSLNQLIHNFLSGKRSYFPDSRTLLLHTRHRIKELEKELEDIEYGRHSRCQDHGGR